ncbi:Bicoid-interacting protein 3 [Teladorsagia circumcincta]|uniref:RNA methyltransferase n=1 Tax=Teladorsagia circumcincta TaxID=45464 RepID=A0A2G9TL44_TELCI|nr:Bicoid-interacting protein 3 [Teladorsagia circumcincta]
MKDPLNLNGIEKQRKKRKHQEETPVAEDQIVSPVPRKQEKLKATYAAIEFKPEDFEMYLIEEVGFESVEHLGAPCAKTKGFERPIDVYLKKPPRFWNVQSRMGIEGRIAAVTPFLFCIFDILLMIMKKRGDVVVFRESDKEKGDVVEDVSIRTGELDDEHEQLLVRDGIVVGLQQPNGRFVDETGVQVCLITS